MTKNTFISLAIWVCLAAVIYYFADNIQNPNKLNRLGNADSVVLKRGPDGHYRSEALINGEKVSVLVDTGATGVAISQKVADRLNLNAGTVSHWAALVLPRFDLFLGALTGGDKRRIIRVSELDGCLCAHGGGGYSGILTI